jgi:hypothetical protein
MTRKLSALLALVSTLVFFRASVARGAPAVTVAPPPVVAVVETRTVGVLAASGDAATRQLYATVARLGYRTIPETVTAALAARVPPGGPAPADLLRIATDAHAGHAVFAVLGTENGRYVVTLTLANSDRTGPFFANDSADATTLEATVDRMARKLLPAAPPLEPSDGEERAPSEAETTNRPRLALQTESAFGLGQRFFYNHLLGARLDYDFGRDFAIGGYLGYANLKGKEGRTSNVLPYAQVEYRLHPRRDSGFTVPFRFGSGYLPKNGPFLRFAAGIGFPIGDTARLGFDLLAPTVWMVGNSTVFSMDVAAEVSFDL